jgi:hypothetical protein
MKRLILLSVSLLIASALPAQSNRVGTYKFVEKVGGHTAQLLFTTAAFDRSKHRITYGKRLDLRVLEVDGRMAMGVDGDLPRVEIRSVEFRFDGKVVEVPHALYADCFEPNFQRDYFALKAGDDGKSLLLFIAGSDGASGYLVVWVLREDGHHSRFSTPCSDFFVDQFAH